MLQQKAYGVANNGCDLQLIAPNHEPEFEFSAFKNGTHPTMWLLVVGCDLLLIAPNHELGCGFGAFKNGTHPTGSAMLSVRSKTERTLRGLQSAM